MKEKLVSLAKSRYFIPTIMMIFSLSLVAYAATHVSVTNTVTITTGGSVAIIYSTAPLASCPTTGSSYSQTPQPVQYSEAAGGSNTTYVCINNVGTGNDNPTISIIAGDPGNCGTGASPCFTLSTTPNPIPSISAGGFTPSPVQVMITNHYLAPPANPQVAITVQVT